MDQQLTVYPKLSTTLRQEAARVGKTRYNTGKPCKHGHFADRYVSTGGCIQCLERAKALTSAHHRRVEGAMPVTFYLHPDDAPAVSDYITLLTEARQAPRVNKEPLNTQSYEDLKAAKGHVLAVNFCRAMRIPYPDEDGGVPYQH